MKRSGVFVIGLSAGLVLGVVISAVAQTSLWMNAEKILDQTREFKQGYALGAFDMLSAIVQAKPSATVLEQRYECLDEQGDTVAVFGDWASAVWRANLARYGRDNAAWLMLTDACN